MAGTANSAEKRKRSRKRKLRTEISSSSESDSEVEQKRTQKADIAVAPVTESSSDVPETPKKQKKEKKKRGERTDIAVNQSVETQDDVSMVDVEEEAVSEPTISAATTSQNEDFTAIYLRKITTELGDDLIKVREAQDFTAKSLPMLIHALKQGESIFSAEEKKRVAGAVVSS